MKKLLIALALLLGTLAVPASAGATSYHSAYSAVYCYPSGSYWQHQIAAYPDYYAAYGSFYASLYGAGTFYC